MQKEKKNELLMFSTQIESNNCNTKYSNNEIYVAAQNAKKVISSINFNDKVNSNELILELDKTLENLSKKILDNPDMSTSNFRNSITLILYKLSELE